MVNITKETYENNGIEVITDKFGKLWLNERHIQQQLGLKNLPALTNKYDEEYKKCRYELIDDPIKQSCRRFIHNKLGLKIIMDCRTDDSCNLKKNRLDLRQPGFFYSACGPFTKNKQRIEKFLKTGNTNFVYKK